MRMRSLLGLLVLLAVCLSSTVCLDEEHVLKLWNEFKQTYGNGFFLSTILFG
jgi:hypothetical protein